MTTSITMSNYIFNTNTDVYSKLVYAAIKKFSNNEGKCFPARNTLAKLCKVSLSTLRKAINSLVEAKVLEKEFRYRENRSQTSNLYTLSPFMISGDFYFKVRADIFELDLSEKETIVYMYLCACSNKDNECYPSIRQIAEACGIGQTSVKVAVKGLIDKNLINKINQFREDGGKRNNLYKIVSADQDAESTENNIEPRPIYESAAHEVQESEDEQKEIFINTEIETEELEITEVIYESNIDDELDINNNDTYLLEKTKDKLKRNMRGDIFDFKLSKNSIMVYLYISTCNELKTGKFPSYEQISRYRKISRSKVNKAILELKNYGLINRLVQGETSNTMVVTEPPPWSIYNLSHGRQKPTPNYNQ